MGYQPGIISEEDAAVLERLVRLEEQCKFFEERCKPERTINHEGVSVVAGHLLSGGGAIDQTRTIGVDFRPVSEAKPNALCEFAFFDPRDNGFFKCSFMQLVESTVAASWIPNRLEGLERVMEELQRKVAVFSIYERIRVLEDTVEDILERYRNGETK